MRRLYCLQLGAGCWVLGVGCCMFLEKLDVQTVRECLNVATLAHLSPALCHRGLFWFHELCRLL